MPDPFVHLRVSSFSLRHGVSTPEDLVGRVADLGQSAIALTDRDGLYGAVKFAQACRDAGIAPILGADLALVHDSAAERVRRSPLRRSPARGGQGVWDPGSRLVVLARGGRGWAALCRLVSAAHLRGERSKPAVTREIVAEYAQQGDLIVMLGADSEVGRALERRRADVAAAELRWWLGAVGVGSPSDRRGLSPVAFERYGARFRRRIGAPHRSALERGGCAPARTGRGRRGGRRADQCSPVCRGVGGAGGRCARCHPSARPAGPAPSRSGECSGLPQELVGVAPVAQEVLALAGRQCRGDLSSLLAGTAGLAEECALDPQGDVGLGDIHVPELSVLDGGGGLSGTRDATSILAGYAGRRRSHAQVDAEAREALGRLRPGARVRSTATSRAAAPRAQRPRTGWRPSSRQSANSVSPAISSL